MVSAWLRDRVRVGVRVRVKVRALVGAWVRVRVGVRARARVRVRALVGAWLASLGIPPAATAATAGCPWAGEAAWFGLGSG